MAIYLTQRPVSEAFAKNAPSNGVITREITSYPDQEGKLHVASVVQWYDPNFGIRFGVFDSKTGEYLGDTLKEE